IENLRKKAEGLDANIAELDLKINQVRGELDALRARHAGDEAFARYEALRDEGVDLARLNYSEIRELRRDFEVINPWPPMLYTELVQLEPGEKRLYSPELSFTPISRSSISCGSMPYANRTVLTKVLLSRRYASLSDKIMAALGLANANRFSPNSDDCAQIQFLIDGIAAQVMPDGTLRRYASLDKYSAFHTTAAALLMRRALEHGYAVGPEVLKSLEARCERLEVTEKDSALLAMLLYCRTTGGRPLPAETTRSRALELMNAPDMTSPAAISMLACVFHAIGDDDDASLAIALAITRERRIMSQLDLFSNEDGVQALPRLFDLMDCKSLPVASPLLHSAAVVYAVASTGLSSFMDQALSLFRNEGFSSSSRAAVDAILLSMSDLEEGGETERTFPANWNKVTLLNSSSSRLYCTASAYGYDLDKSLEPESSDLNATVTVHNRDDQPSLPGRNVRIGDDFVLALDLRSHKQDSSIYKIMIPLMPGLKFERVLTGFDQHYMKLGPLNVVLSAQSSEREVTLLVHCHGNASSRIALLMRPQMRGRFAIPSVEVTEQHGVLKPVYWVSSGTVNVL
ncbi:MAG: hypothetical protein ACI4NA_00310, partial [Succinivibrio sp.]